MNIKDFNKLKPPQTPGVYFFKKGRTILYIGKATSLRDRVRSYFNDDLIKTRGRLLVDMVTHADTILYEQTDSVLEAFIQESTLIKKHQPRYNTKEKDNKSFNYVVITKEDFPRILVMRGRDLEKSIDPHTLQSEEGVKMLTYTYTDIFGPYPFGAELREAMKLIRRIFPYRDTCTPYTGSSYIAGKIDADGAHIIGREVGKGKQCFNRSIGLCPGVCTGEISKKEYAHNIKNIRLFFKGKKQALQTALTQQMKAYAQVHEFEKAGEVKRTLYALTHIQDISMIKKTSSSVVAEKTAGGFRIEAYDIAHLSGKDMVGVMVVMEGGEYAKNQYKKFTIRSVKQSDDTGALREMLTRRLRHTEWPLPQLFVIDGGKAQINAVENVLTEHNIKGVGLVSVVKDDTHKAREFLYSEAYPAPATTSNGPDMAFFDNGDIVSVNQECHRFAIAFHKKRRASSRGL